MQRRQDYVEAIESLRFYEALSRQLTKHADESAENAHNLYLECHALSLQITASIGRLQREMDEKFPKRWWQFWRQN